MVFQDRFYQSSERTIPTIHSLPPPPYPHAGPTPASYSYPLPVAMVTAWVPGGHLVS